MFWFFSLADFDSEWMLSKVRFVLGGLQFTILLAVAATVLACLLALVGALCRISRNPVLYAVAGFYTSFFRGTPLIVQLFLIYLALPQIAAGFGNPEFTQLMTLSAFQAGIIGLGLNYGAYLTEIFRAGIQAVPHGQYEAAEALGMTYRQRMRRVVLPQALRVIIPPTGNEFIAMIKDTALVQLPRRRGRPGRGLPTGQPGRQERLPEPRGAAARRPHLLGAHRDLHLLPGPAGAPAQQGVRAHVGGRALDRAGGRQPRPGRAADPSTATTTGGHHDDGPRRSTGTGPCGPGPGPAQVLRLPRGAHQRGPDRGPRRGRGHLRPVRFGEEHPAALPELPRGPDRGHDRGRRSDARGWLPDPSQARARAPAAAARRHGLPAVQPVPAHDGAGERDRGADHREGHGQGRGPPTRSRAARPRGAGRQGRRAPDPAVRRPAAARRHRPRAGHGPRGHALRRADLRPRPRAHR